MSDDNAYGKSHIYIKTDVIDYLNKTVEEFNKRIQKMKKKGRIVEDFPEVSYEIVKFNQKEFESFLKEDKNLTGLDRDELLAQYSNGLCQIIKFKIDEIPSFVENFDVLAKIEVNENGKYLLYNYSKEKPIPKKYFNVENTDPCKCEHCNVNRKRNATFIIYDKQKDEHLQIGSSCMKDFANKQTLESMIYYSEYIKFLEEIRDTDSIYKGAYGARIEKYIDKYAFIAAANKAIARNGYIKSGRDNFGEGIPSTFSAAYYFLNKAELSRILDSKYDSHRRYRDFIESIEINEKDIEEAEMMADYIAERIDEEDCNPYEFNLKMLIMDSSPVLKARNAGIIAYLPQLYRNHIENKNKRDFAKKAKESYFEVPSYIGLPTIKDEYGKVNQKGSKIESLQVKLLKVSLNTRDAYYYGDDAVYTYYKLMTEDGRLVAYAASNELIFDCFTELGLKYTGDVQDYLDEKKLQGESVWFTISGTVKKHHVSSKDEKITYLTRAKSANNDVTSSPKNSESELTLDEKYKLKQLKLIKIEEKTSFVSEKTNYAYHFEDVNQNTYLHIRNDKLNDMELDNIYIIPSQEVEGELYGVMNGKYKLVNEFDPEFNNNEQVTRKKAIKLK